MTSITSTDRERQRFEHLVLGRARPLPEMPKRPEGMAKLAWKVARAEIRKTTSVALAHGIEEEVAIREAWSHKQGTPQTHEQLAGAQRRPGSLARLYASEAIDKDQLAAAQQIAEAYRAITADVAVRTASLETRVDGGCHGRAEAQAIGRVHVELAYDFWRGAVGGCVDALLAVIVHDVGLTIVARDGGISMSRARRMLVDALDLWPIARRRTMRAAATIAG